MELPDNKGTFAAALLYDIPDGGWVGCEASPNLGCIQNSPLDCRAVTPAIILAIVPVGKLKYSCRDMGGDVGSVV